MDLFKKTNKGYSYILTINDTKEDVFSVVENYVRKNYYYGDRFRMTAEKWNDAILFQVDDVDDKFFLVDFSPLAIVGTEIVRLRGLANLAFLQIGEHTD